MTMTKIENGEENPSDAILKLCQQIKQLNDDEYERLKLPKDIDLNHYSSKTSGWLPIHFAAAMGKERILNSLIQKGANPYLSLNTLDTATGLKATWKTAFYLMQNKEMKERVRSYYISHIQKYNESHTMIGQLPGITLIRIAENFLVDLPSLAHFSLASTFLFALLNQYLISCKKMNDKQQKVTDYLGQLAYYETFNPMSDDGPVPMSLAEVNQLQNEFNNGGREKLIQSTNQKIEKIKKEIDEMHNSLSASMKL
jgi:hypothetical protein